MVSKKWLHAALVALAAGLAEMSMQLSNAGVLTKAAVAGIMVGLVARILGAIVAASE